MTDIIAAVAGDQPQFINVDGLTIRYMSSPKPAAESVMLLSPWPESMYAFLPMWPALSRDFSLVAVDLPGFGQSEGRQSLMGPRAMGEFVVQIAAGLGLDQPHAVGPDVGTGALLFAAATHPGAFRSLIVGAGAATFPLHVDGVLKAFVDAESVETFSGLDPADVVRQVVGSIRNYAVPDAVREDYIQSYAGPRFLESMEYVRNYPTDLADLSPLLSDISTPVQIIVGRDDPYGLAADGELLHQKLPRSRLDILDCGHNAWEEEADRYGSVIADWIDGGFHTA
jgi:pimeloyl-ACP methyl ester carboxylesterase